MSTAIPSPDKPKALVNDIHVMWRQPHCKLQKAVASCLAVADGVAELSCDAGGGDPKVKVNLKSGIVYAGFDYAPAYAIRRGDLERLRRLAMDVYITDGGRKAAGLMRKSKRGDCVIRAISIATEQPYEKVRDDLNERACVLSDVADYGTNRDVYGPYLSELGWTWVPTMTIGSGCRVHLRADELPPGRLIVRVSGHLVAVIDGVIHDAYDPSRGGTRCVYGYHVKTLTKAPAAPEASPEGP